MPKTTDKARKERKANKEKSIPFSTTIPETKGLEFMRLNKKTGCKDAERIRALILADIEQRSK